MICRLLLAALLISGSSLVTADVDVVNADEGGRVELAQAPETDAATSPRLSPSLLDKPKTQVGSAVVTADPVALMMGMAFVVLLIFLVAWLLRRMGAVSLVSGQAMRVVAALSVGPREKVVLVDIGGKQLLLGVAPGRVSSLHEFDQPVISADKGAVGEFSLKLKQLMQGGANVDKGASSSEQSANR